MATNHNVSSDIAWSAMAPKPVAGDSVYVHDGARLTMDENGACLIISLGETSGGAAAGGQRYGKITWQLGVTMAWDGDADRLNSGLKIDPALADASSKDCEWITEGVDGTRVVFTNSVGARNAANKWSIEALYGLVRGDYLDAQYSYTHLIQVDPRSAVSNASEFVLDHLRVLGGLANGAAIFFLHTATENDIPLRSRRGELEGAVAIGNNYIVNGTLRFLHDADVSDWKFYHTSGAIRVGPLYGFSLKAISAPNYYIGDARISQTDIRGTELAPTSFAVTDGESDGDLIFTWANGGSYVSGKDWVHIFNNDGYTEIAVVDASLGTFEKGGFTNDVLITAYAKASSDGVHFSAATATDNATPTVSPGDVAPAIPVLVSVVPGDTKLTITLTGESGKDYYSRVWDAIDGLSAESGTFKVTGNGATPVSISHTGLTNRRPYMIVIYGKDGTACSDVVMDGIDYVPDTTTSLTYEKIGNLIRSRVKTQIEDGQSVEVLYDNMDEAAFTKPTDAAWVRAALLPGEATQRTFGGSTNRFRKVGVLHITVYNPIEKGDKVNRELADAVVDAFRNVSASGVVFKTPSLGVAMRDGMWWRQTITCPYYADDFGG